VHAVPRGERLREREGLTKIGYAPSNQIREMNVPRDGAPKNTVIVIKWLLGTRRERHRSPKVVIYFRHQANLQSLRAK